MPIYSVLQDQISELMRYTTSSTDIKPTLTGRSLADQSFYRGAKGYLNLESPQTIRRGKKLEKASRKISELEKVENSLKKISLFQNVTNLWNTDDDDSYASIKKS